MLESKQDVKEFVASCASKSMSRMELWVDFIQASQPQNVAEVGVYRGDFSAQMLKECSSIEKYYMIDPWRHIGDWNKPANVDNNVFENFLAETKAKTDFASQKRIILRGKTTEVVEQIQNEELDFAYIDGDHTLKGISIDLIRILPKIKPGGFIGGDDFIPTVWQHSTAFEPTLVFPFSVYFAEAIGAQIYALPNSQFLIRKPATGESCHFEFVDLVKSYSDVSIGSQLEPNKILKKRAKEKFPNAYNVAATLTRRFKD